MLVNTQAGQTPVNEWAPTGDFMGGFVSLAEKNNKVVALGYNPASNRRLCGIKNLRDLLADKDDTELAALNHMLGNPKLFPSIALALDLASEGYGVSHRVIQKHRNHECSCDES